MKTETSVHNPDEFTLKEKLTYGIVGLLMIGGSFFIGRSLIRKARATAEEKKTYEDGSPATFAKQINMAFENDNWLGWGTDEEALRKTLQAIPSKEAMRKVINSYQKLYARAMMADMQSELTTSEYNEMLAIIAAKPETGGSAIEAQSTPLQYQSWAKRLKAAFDITYWFIPGTDEPAIKAVFMEMRTQADFWQTAAAYQSLYGSELLKDLQSELEIWEYVPMMDILMKKPKT
ncbi:MAG: annexin [Chitinophagaceae bacterium]|nr:annexin [Chitinophagaceae bacterium]